MKKVLKGFTLIELIVVMAILTILMAGIMQMFKPIRETYVDSTLIESQRTAQNGIVQYITESIRYCTDLGIYTEVKDIEDAADTFADAYIAAAGVDPTDPMANTIRDTIKKKAEVIVVNMKPGAFMYGGKARTGRLIRRKEVVRAGQVEPLDNTYESLAFANKCRMALGEAYYGNGDYYVTIKPPAGIKVEDWNAADGIEVVVASNMEYGARSIGKGNQVVATDGLVICPNLTSSVNGKSLAACGVFDLYGGADKSSASNLKFYSRDTSVNPGGKTPSSNIYIVYLEGDDTKGLPEAKGDGGAFGGNTGGTGSPNPANPTPTPDDNTNKNPSKPEDKNPPKEEETEPPKETESPKETEPPEETEPSETTPTETEPTPPPSGNSGRNGAATPPSNPNPSTSASGKTSNNPVDWNVKYDSNIWSFSQNGDKITFTSDEYGSFTFDVNNWGTATFVLDESKSSGKDNLKLGDYYADSGNNGGYKQVPKGSDAADFWKQYGIDFQW